MDKGAGLVIKFRVRILQMSMVVLGRAANLKTILCYVRKPCSVVGPSRHPKKEDIQICRLLTMVLAMHHGNNSSFRDCSLYKDTNSVM